MSDDIERTLGDALADGKITDGDAEAVREFAEFLRIAGPPVRRDANGKPIPLSADDVNPFERLRREGRWDLLDYAMPHSPIVEASWWNSLDAEEAIVNTASDPPYSVAAVTEILFDMLPDRHRLLDLGCGMGRLTNYLAHRLELTQAPFDRCYVHGLDISQQMLFRATFGKPPNAYYWRGDGRGFPAGLLGPFTGAYSVAMFQHIPAEAMWGYIRLVHEHLEPGGKFAFTIAVGDADEFLNHQISDADEFMRDLVEIFDSTQVDVATFPDDRGWHWVLAEKGK